MKIDKYFFMDFVYNKVKKCSTCARYQVGAVIVKDNRIVSFGYNGTFSKHLECSEVDKLLHDMSEIEKKEHAKGLEIIYEDLKKSGFKKRDKNHFYSILLSISNEYLRELLEKYKDNLIVAVKNIYESLKQNENIIHSKYEIHAEQNAILYACKNNFNLDGSEIYVSMEPCLECAKLILISGIKRVYYVDSYTDKRFNINSTRFLQEVGVTVEQLRV